MSRVIVMGGVTASRKTLVSIGTFFIVASVLVFYFV
jgi:hypothetical protein